MKFTSIKRKLTKITLQRMILSVVIVAVVVGFVPHVADANTKKALSEAIFFTSSTPFEEVSAQEGYPVAEDREPVRSYTVVMTAYSSEVAQTDATPCIPANGYDLCKHYEEYGEGNTVANNCLPLGTQVRFPDLFGDKVFIVRDRMNARYGCYRMDIWMEGRQVAKQFGVKRTTVEVFGRTLVRSR